MQARAILHTAAHAVTLGDVTLPAPQAGEVLIETLFSCVSPGTELRALAGRQPDMPAGAYIPGYALTGTVIARGPGVAIAEGCLVFCSGTRTASAPLMWGGHISHAIQREAAIFPLPPGVDPLEASLAKLAAIAYHGMRLSRPLPHERVAVIGLGPIGQLSARLHSLTGAYTVGVDPVASRVELAEWAGLTARVAAGTPAETLGAVLPDGADIIVDATGAPAVIGEVAALARALPWDDSLSAGARYLLQGSYAGSVPIPYSIAFERELQLMVPRDLQPRDLRAVLDLLARGRLRARDLISAVVAPSAAAEAYTELRAHPERLMTLAFDWRRNAAV